MKYNNSVKIGEYPKWLGKVIVWGLSKAKAKDMRFKLYGRGKGSSQRNYGALPVKYCPRVAVYVYFFDKSLESMRDSLHRQYNRTDELARQLEDRQE